MAQGHLSFLIHRIILEIWSKSFYLAAVNGRTTEYKQTDVLEILSGYSGNYWVFISKWKGSIK